MNTLRLFSHIGKNARTIALQYFATGSYTVNQPLSLVRIQPSFVNCISPVNSKLYHAKQRYISNKSDYKGTAGKESPAALTNEAIIGESSKLGLFARFKFMYKKYWYVLIPVHVVTSVGWLAGFYFLSQSGVDIPTVLHTLHVSETIIEKVQNSSMGHLAIAYLCYKVATPIRYALTLGGTTLSIKYLVQTGYIKPEPTEQEKEK